MTRRAAPGGGRRGGPVAERCPEEEHYRELAAASRTAQGLPPQVEDAAVLACVATLLGMPAGRAAARRPRGDRRSA